MILPVARPGGPERPVLLGAREVALCGGLALGGLGLNSLAQDPLGGHEGFRA